MCRTCHTILRADAYANLAKTPRAKGDQTWRIPGFREDRISYAAAYNAEVEELYRALGAGPERRAAIATGRKASAATISMLSAVVARTMAGVR